MENLNPLNPPPFSPGPLRGPGEKGATDSFLRTGIFNCRFWGAGPSVPSTSRSDGLSVLRWRSGSPWPRIGSEKRMAAVLVRRLIFGGDLFAQFLGVPSHGILEPGWRTPRLNGFLQSLELLALTQPMPFASCLHGSLRETTPLSSLAQCHVAARKPRTRNLFSLPTLILVLLPNAPLD